MIINRTDAWKIAENFAIKLPSKTKEKTELELLQFSIERKLNISSKQNNTRLSNVKRFDTEPLSITHDFDCGFSKETNQREMFRILPTVL